MPFSSCYWLLHAEDFRSPGLGTKVIIYFFHFYLQIYEVTLTLCSFFASDSYSCYKGLYFLLSHAEEALKCPKCFSKVSEEDCDLNAVPMNCTRGQTVCLFYQQSSTMAGKRFFRYCSTEMIFLSLTTLCNRQRRNPVRPRLSKYGEIRCKAYSCRSNNCFAGRSSGNKAAHVDFA